MCKNVFTLCLKGAYPQLSCQDINKYWDLALKAELPEYLFNHIKPAMIRLPRVYNAYIEVKGYAPMVFSEENARRAILDKFVEGELYMRDIQRIFTISDDMRRDVLKKLCKSRFLSHSHCKIGNCLSYEFNSKIKLPGQLDKKLKCILAQGEQTIYQLHLNTLGFDYAQVCIWVYRNVHGPESKYFLSYRNNQVIVAKRRSFNV